jgi:hypothetical protein
MKKHSRQTLSGFRLSTVFHHKVVKISIFSPVMFINALKVKIFVNYFGLGNRD